MIQRIDLGLQRRTDGFALLLSALVLIGCLFYALLYGFLTPFSGLVLNSGWIVISIDSCASHPGWCEMKEPILKVGDKLSAVGDLTFEEYVQDRLLVPFDGFEPGAEVSLKVEREAGSQTIEWLMPRSTSLTWRLVNSSILLAAFPFWLAGTVILFFLRPRGSSWYLMLALNYLIALWLCAGSVSHTNAAASSLVLHALTWLLVPVAIHLHLSIPLPSHWRLIRYVLPPIYIIAFFMATLEVFQLLPTEAFNIGMLTAIGGSLILLFLRSLFSSASEMRRGTRLLWAGIFLALAPGVVIGTIPDLLGQQPPEALSVSIAILAVPALPSFYLYSVFKKYMGELEFRANRLMGFYSFFLVYGTVFILTTLVAYRWMNLDNSPLLLNISIASVFIIAAPFSLSRFQRFFERFVYGVRYNPDEIVHNFASQMPSARDHGALIDWLIAQVTKSLFIRQSALYLFVDKGLYPVYEDQIENSNSTHKTEQVRELLNKSGLYRPPSVPRDETKVEWVRLALPLKIQNLVIGIWLFGRRDPDDFYPKSDITLLETLASQTAVVVKNARLLEQAKQELIERERTEKELAQANRRLQELARQLIGTQEDERRRIAQDLHDETGQTMTALTLKLNSMLADQQVGSKYHSQLTSAVQLLDESMKNQRKLIYSLRPPALDAAPLGDALRGLCVEFARNTGIKVNYSAGRTLPPLPEMHALSLYRLVQEGLTNVAKHADAKAAWINVDFEDDIIDVSIEDDGKGFSMNHEGGIGLQGLVERFQLLDGVIQIDSSPGQGTRLMGYLPFSQKHKGDELQRAEEQE